MEAYLKKILVGILICIIFNLQLQSVVAEDKNTGYIMSEAKSLIFEYINREDGLSNLSVSSVIQDKYGFLWFGTQGGLNHYNGRTFEVLRHNPLQEDGLIHNLIQTMYYDEENHELWIGTYQGISRYIISENRFVNFTVENHQLSNPIVSAITKDNNGDMWFGTMSGLNRLASKNDTFTQYEVPGDIVRALLVDSKGDLVIGTHEGLGYFDYEENEVVIKELDLPSDQVMVVKEFDPGIITLGLWDGGVIELETATNIFVHKSFANNNVCSLMRTSEGELWVGTWGGGLFIKTLEGDIINFENDGKVNTLSHNVVYSIFQDDSDIIWLGTNGGGINKINPRRYNFVDMTYDPADEQSLSQGKINTAIEDSNGDLWIAIDNNGLNRYNSATHLMDKYRDDSEDKEPLPDNQINVFYEDDDKLLIGSNTGLARYDEETDTFIPYKGIPEGTIINAIEGIGEDELWLGTYNNGIYIYDLNTKTYKTITADDPQHPIADNLIYDIYKDTQGRLWIGTNNGLNVWDMSNEIFETYKKEQGNYDALASNTIRSIYEDSSGRIWLSTVDGGVSYYAEDQGDFVTYTEEDGMPSNTVIGVAEDSAGTIWCATENGIATIRTDSNEIFYLTPDDGIGGWEFSSEVIETSDDSLIFGGVHGITHIPEGFINSPSPEPRVYIIDVELFHEPIDSSRQFFNDAVLEFGPDDSYLEFKVAALDYDSPSETKFSYKLEGFDDVWVNAGTRDYISYSNLPAGDYELMIMAETARNVVTEPVSLKFKIATAWYRTIYAYIAYLILALLLVYSMFKLREASVLQIRNSELAVINGKLEDANVNLEQLSTRDALTNLFNRRYFDVMFANYLKLSIRGNTHLSLIMIDLDDFKKVNDNFGHIAGDLLMTDVAEKLDHMMDRATDFVARYGGDELVIVLYDTEMEATLHIADRIATSVRSVQVREIYASDPYFVTVSVGVVCETPKPNSLARDYIDAADRALYRSKESGKNCVNVCNFAVDCRE